MPLYDCKCNAGHKFERMIPLANFSEPIHCDCNELAFRLISSPMFSVDTVGYNCPVTGEWVGSGRAHRENLKRQGCRVLEAGEKEAAATFRQRADEDLDKKIEATVEKEIDAMPSEKREKLYAEMTRGGADVSYERGPA